MQPSLALRHRPRPVNWRQEYLHLSVVAMTACWMAGWVALTLRWFIDINLATALGISAAHLLASMAYVRVAMRRSGSSRLMFAGALVLMWVAAGLTALLMPSLARAYGGEEPLTLTRLFQIDEGQQVPAGPLMVIWILILWWRGYQLGTEYMTLVRASFGLRLGILSFLLVSLLADQSLRGDLLALVPFFFFFGLLGSSLARADSLSLDRARRITTFGRGWMVSLFLLTLAVTVIGYAAALTLTGMETGHLAKTLAEVGRGAILVVFVLATPVLYAVQVGYDFITSILPEQLRGETVEITTGQGSGGGINAPWMSDVFTLLTNAFLIAVGALILIALLAFIWFLLVARGERKDPEGLEERESLGTGEMVGGLRQSLREGWRRLAEALRLFRQFGLGQDLFAALTIRRIYLRMERLASARGFPRGLAETPYEYRRALSEAFPERTDDIQRITAAYIAVRYGDVPENASELDAVRAAWERIHASPAPSP
jgi:hypothetical protein